MAIGTLLSMFVSFGTNSLATKEISRDPQVDRELLGNIFPSRILAGITLWSVLTIIVLGFPDDRKTAVIIVVVGLFHVVLKWQSLLLSRFRSRQSMQFVVAVQVGTRVGKLALNAPARIVSRPHVQC